MTMTMITMTKLNNDYGDDDDDDDNDDDDDDDGDNTGGNKLATCRDARPLSLSSKDRAISDECLEFFERLTKGGHPSSSRSRPGSTRLAKSSSSALSRTLSKKSKMGNFKNMKKMFSTDYINKMGRGVLTRAAKKRLSEGATAAIAAESPNKEVTRNLKSHTSPVAATPSSKSGPAAYTLEDKVGSISPYKEMMPGTSKTAATARDDKYEGEPISFSTHEGDPGQQTSYGEDETISANAQCEFLENSLLLIDDAFCHKSSCISAESSNKQKNSEYLNTLRFVQALTQKWCHHYSWHLCITSQAPLSSAGTSAVAQMFRDIRTNLDGIAVFSLVLRELQTLLTQIYSGEQYTYVKRLLKHLHDEFDEHPADKRVYRPVLILGLNPSTKKALQFR